MRCGSNSRRVVSGVTFRPPFAIGRQFCPAAAALQKKVDQKTRRKLLPLTDDVLRQHLEGKHTVGVYPLLH